MNGLKNILSVVVITAAGVAGQVTPAAPAPPAVPAFGDRLSQEIREQVRMAQAQAREAVRSVRQAEEYTNDSYRSGQSALDRHDYDRAIKRFDSVIESKSPRADGAMYWKAYSLHKLGRREDAQAVLAALEKQFPQSRWLNDARALAAEVRSSSGQPSSPESQSDEELKLLAMNSLMQQDPDRAIPLLEKVLADPKNSPSLKGRAIFVLAQSKSPRARQIVLQYAKGGSNPDVQMRALEYLGTFRTDDGAQTLAEVYASTSDTAVKRTILRGLLVSRAKDRMVQVARTEQDVSLREEAIRYLATMQAEPELVAMYKNESNVEVKRTIVQSLFQSPKQLVELARAEPNAELKRDIVRQLSMSKSKEAADYLAELINK
jgi:tetratricopeptide (TPR) repeat protein